VKFQEQQIHGMLEQPRQRLSRGNSSIVAIYVLFAISGDAPRANIRPREQPLQVAIIAGRIEGPIAGSQ
jgi:hypothetical protein